MDYQRRIIEELSRNREVFRSLLSGKNPDEYFWRPSPDKWNLLEIVCHLHDEEVEDFKARVKHTLANNQNSPKPIDPEGWVKQRNYMGKDYESVLADFLMEREKSVEWLKGLADPRWENFYLHPKLGPLSAGFFLSNWLAHDYLHIRQINRYNYLFLKGSTDVNLSYAGDW